MRANIPELLFSSRKDFHVWLKENVETSEWVWLVFGKTKEVITLSSNDALEEALCFGWIDGQMQSIDNTKYLKYFAWRRVKSVWSEKKVETLRAKGLMTEFGEKAVEEAIKSGSWDAPKGNPITEEQVKAFEEKLACISPAYEILKVCRVLFGSHTRVDTSDLRLRKLGKGTLKKSLTGLIII